MERQWRGGAKREHRFVVSCLDEDQRCLCLFHMSACGFMLTVPECVVSVAAFSFSPTTDGLRQLGEGCDGKHFAQVS